MASTTPSSNMSLPVPIVGVDTGPQYATDLNNCLTTIDSHDHTSGKGPRITPGAININADLPMNAWSITGLLKASLNSQVAVITGTNFLSVVGGNLYFNDGSGNQIAMTSAGGVAGTAGSIGSLVAPASATYSAGSKLFIWQAGVNKSAAMDHGASIIRETNVASAKGVTLASPTSLGADYQITLLTALPGSTMALNMDSSGNMGTISYDSIGVGMTPTGANAIATTRTRATGTSVAAGGVALSASSASFLSTSTSYVDVTNLSVTIITSGRPVVIELVSDGSGLASYISVSCGGVTASENVFFKCLRDAVEVGQENIILTVASNAGSMSVTYPCSSLRFADAPVAGTYVYKIQTKVGAGSPGTASSIVSQAKLRVYEL